ncbi:unnamed protein product [Effrenium voratum]|uniref:poly(A)-specific ribonuclease n=1 Tax=Effrenium voratum TaxID=2562239 RepID=A0AA36NH39_9DINO|nr:unnamed protein product [Effrenium voratum]
MTSHRLRDVWAGNLQREFLAFQNTLRLAGKGAFVAIDTEFSGVLQEDAWKKSSDLHYLAMRESVDVFRPLQLGLAIGSQQGQSLVAWNFNLRFDLQEDLYTDSAVQFLSGAGLDFQRHATEGIDCGLLRALLGGSELFAQSSWLTFAGSYDLGYLLRLLSPSPLPAALENFEALLDARCAARVELRDALPFGSLASLAEDHGVLRRGCAHTAGSDALLTLDLFFRMKAPAGEVDVNDASEFKRKGDCTTNSTPSAPTGPARSSWGKAARLEMYSSAFVPSSLWGVAARSVADARL